MGRRGGRRVLLTVLFTDIVGSTDLARELGDRTWEELLRRHHEIVRRELKRFGGRERDTAGDGFFATFETPANAVRCAAAVVDGVRELGIEVRAGVHTGEVELSSAGVRGIAVHLGARVMASAGAGEVLVSATTRDLIAGSRIGFDDRGLHELKGIEGETHLFVATSVEGSPFRVTLDPAEAAERRAALADAPAERRRRTVRIAGVAVVVTAIVIVVTVALARGGHGVRAVAHDTSAPTAGASPTPTLPTLTRDLTPAELDLEATIPEPIRSSCAPFATPTEAAVASLACTTPDARIVYERYASSVAMDQIFEQLATATGADPGDCSTDRLATQVYRVGDEPAGRVLCDSSGGRALLTWTDRRSLVLSRAIRDDGADLSLYAWWLANAGPIVPGQPDSLVKDGTVPAAPTSGAWWTEVTSRDAESDRLRSQRTKLGSSDTRLWVGLWALELDDGGGYVLRHGFDVVETGTFGLAKSGHMSFTAATGDCAGSPAATYAFDLVDGAITWHDPTTNDVPCLAGPWPVDIHPWTAPPSGSFALGMRGSIVDVTLATLTTTTIVQDGVSASWSPDGSRIAFSRLGTSSARLWVAGADESDAQAIGPGVDDLDAAWSPDGRWIAFHTDKGNRSTLSLIHPDGTGRVDLVRGQANVGRPAWSLDSNVLAFREDTTIYTVRRDGSDLHRVIDAGVVDDSPMAWTPDGRIVFWGDEHHGTGLYAVDPDGSNLELLFAPPGLAPPVLSPSVSPNGRWILLAGEWDNPEPLFLVGISGSPVFEIVNTAIASEPRWTPPAT